MSLPAKPATGISDRFRRSDPVALCRTNDMQEFIKRLEDLQCYEQSHETSLRILC